MITIINADGCVTRTENVEACEAETHIKAHDSLANEAMILNEYRKLESENDPIAWKYNDPTEDARFLFTEEEVSEIEAIDKNLIERIKIKYL